MSLLAFSCKKRKQGCVDAWVGCMACFLILSDVMLQPYDTRFCPVQLISAHALGVVLLGCLALTLRLLLNCAIGSLKGHSTEVWYLPSNLCCPLQSFSFNLLLSLEICQRSFCSGQAVRDYWFSGSIFVWCDYCTESHRRGATPWKRYCLEDGCVDWEAFEFVPVYPLPMKIWEQSG